MGKASEAQKKAVYRYVKENYDSYPLHLPKGQKEIVKRHAAKMNESINAFVNRAIRETMERDQQK